MTDLNDALIVAVTKRYSDIVLNLIQEGADPNCAKDGIPILNFAIMNKDLKTTKVLIEGGADLTKTNKNGELPLDYAKTFYDEEIFDLVRKHSIVKIQKSDFDIVLDFGDDGKVVSDYLSK